MADQKVCDVCGAIIPDTRTMVDRNEAGRSNSGVYQYVNGNLINSHYDLCEDCAKLVDDMIKALTEARGKGAEKESALEVV